MKKGLILSAIALFSALSFTTGCSKDETSGKVYDGNS